MTWDLIVVGAGPAGLTMALHVLRRHPSAQILILEKTNKVGGRTRTLTFAGKKELPCGAGVGRTKKDRRLAAWLTGMGFTKKSWVSRPFLGFLTKGADPPFSLNALVKRLEKALRPSDARRTFQAFAKEHLTPAEWQWFQSAMGYTDYLQADAWETVKYYGFDDNKQPLHGFTVPWTALAEKTRDVLKASGVVFRYGATALAIRDTLEGPMISWQQTISGKQTIHQSQAKAIVVAVPVQGLRELFPNVRAYRPNALDGQPFIRLYASLNASGRNFMKASTGAWHDGMAMVQGAFQKISVLDESKGIYRLAYADNARAIALRKLLREKYPNQALTQELRKAIGGDLQEDNHPTKPIHYIKHWKACEWFPTGTHYYPPLPSWASTREAYLYEAQRPMPNIWVVGEAVSRDQGWTEGALTSVEIVLPEILQNLTMLKLE